MIFLEDGVDSRGLEGNFMCKAQTPMYPESFLSAIQLILTPVIPGWHHRLRAQLLAVFGLHKIVLARSALNYNYKKAREEHQ
jgi:hypothetical protein